MPQNRRITVLMDLVGGYGRGLFDGVAKYSRLSGKWDLWLQPSTVWRGPEVTWDWDSDGALIFALWTPPVEEALQRGLPMVNLTAVQPRYPVLTVDVDHYAIGQMAGNYYLERGMRDVGFVGWPQSAHSIERRRGFADAIGTRATVHTYVEHWSNQRPVWPEAGLVEWLRDLPKPVGIFAANDERAVLVIEACRSARLAIPEQVAVLGVDDDDIVIKRLPLELSSIQLPADRVGYEAAAILDQLMDGKAVEPVPRFHPLGVVTRQSTEMSSVKDPEVAQAIYFMRTHFAEEISVPDVAAAVAISKRSLEQRFRKAIGLSPVQFLIRTRIEQAKRLLVNTDLKMPTVAQRAGFSDASHLGVVFLRQTGITPTAFRDRSRIVS